MGKKKGRQCGGFPSKAMRAVFSTEWQSLASQVELSKRRHTHHVMSGSSVKQQSQERPKFRLTHLQNVLQERLQHDRLEERARRQSQRMTDAARKQDSVTLTPPPFNTYDEHDDDYREGGLALLCIKALAPVLQEYIDSMGRDGVHYMLSLLPGKTLTALSVELSLRNLWTSKDALYVVTHHAHISRLAIYVKGSNNSSNNNITEEDLEEALVMSQSSSIMNQQQRVIPESWEDEVSQEEEDECKTLRLLQRLELRNFPQLSTETTLSLISSHTTHLSLYGSLNPTSGPQVLEKLASSENCFQLLDVSNCDWVSFELLRLVEPNVLHLRAEGCCKDE